MKKNQVFISYKSEEYKEAKKVKNFLEENGIECWMAPDSIPGGKPHSSEIAKAIKSSRCFVLMLSEKSQESKDVLRELTLADECKDCTILPYIMDNLELTDEMRYYLSIFQHYKAYEDSEKALSDLANDIKKELPEDKKELPKKMKKNKPVKEKRKIPVDKKKRLLTVAAILVGFILCGFVFKKANEIEIAGQIFEKNTTRLEFKDVDLTKSDLDKMKKLKDVTFYEISQCTFPDQDLSGIFNKNANYLYLSDCNLTDEHIASLGLNDFVSLYGFGVDGNKEVTCLKNAEFLGSELQALYISDTGISDLDFLISYRNLSDLYAKNNEITDISVLSNCRDLLVLGLSGNQISSLEPLAACEKLKIVNVSDNELTSLAGLETCIRLECIIAENNKLTSIDGLCNSTILNSVYVSDNELTDISILEKSVDNIKNLHFSNNQITDISFLQEAKNLTYLNGDNNQIKDITALNTCTELIGVSMQANGVEELGNFAKNSRNIVFLDLSDNNIVSMVPIVGIGGADAISIDISNNQIENLRLIPLREYSYLDIHGNAIDSLPTLENSRGQDLIFEYHENIDYEKLSQAEFTYIYIINCPLDRQVELENILGKYVVSFISEEEFENMSEQEIPWQLERRGPLV